MTVARINPDLVSAFCAACKSETMVGPSLACPDCGQEVEPTSLAAMPKRVIVETQKPAQRAAVLPRIKASVQLDGALDAVIVALEDEERTAQTAYEAAKERYRTARQALADARQLRGLVKVAGEPVASAPRATAAPAEGKRWANKFDACVTCGRDDSQHQGKGECARCKQYRKTHGHARPRSLDGAS